MKEDAMLTVSRRNDSPYVRQALVYFGLLTLLLALPAPNGFLIDIQTSFMLKNHMNATATQVSMFRLITALPVYLGFVFGLVRDRWDPLGLRDRGYFLIFAPVAAIAFVWLAFSGLSYRGLLVGMLGVMVVFGFLGAAYQGLMALLYGYLCRRIALNKLLWWGTIVGVPQMIPLVFIHSANLSLIMAVPMGLMGGVASAAYIDLAMRSCPPGLQGTLMMMVGGAFALSARGGDLLGSRIYNSSPEHGFLYCVIATTVVYALILPLIPLVPKELIATADGEPNPGAEAALLKEVAGTEPVFPVLSGFRPEPELAPLLPLSVGSIVSIGDTKSADPANSNGPIGR